MSTRNEHFRLLAGVLNITSGGTFVAAIATVPLNVFSSGKIDFPTATNLVVLFVMGSFFLHGLAQVALMQVEP